MVVRPEDSGDGAAGAFRLLRIGVLILLFERRLNLAKKVGHDVPAAGMIVGEQR
jgi:hypothetical protein